jgi:small subunit ribosomal protein S6
MAKNYEMLYIAHPDLEANIEVISQRVQSLVTARGGTVESEDIWGKRKLAYPIRKLQYGVYVLVNFALEPDKLADLNRQLLLLDEVIRFMIIIRPERKESTKPRRAPRPLRAKTEAPAETEKPEKKEPTKDESERMKELDKKLEEIIGADV